VIIIALSDSLRNTDMIKRKLFDISFKDIICHVVSNYRKQVINPMLEILI